jgi:hypothetical protein
MKTSSKDFTPCQSNMLLFIWIFFQSPHHIYVGFVHTCTKQWSLCGIFGKNGLKSMWSSNLIKHLVVSRIEKNVKEMFPKWIYETSFPPRFGPLNLVFTSLNAMKYCWKVTNKDEEQISKNSPCAKHNLEFVLNLYYKKFVDYHTMIGNHTCFSELF